MRINYSIKPDYLENKKSEDELLKLEDELLKLFNSVTWTSTPPTITSTTIGYHSTYQLRYNPNHPIHTYTAGIDPYLKTTNTLSSIYITKL